MENSRMMMEEQQESVLREQDVSRGSTGWQHPRCAWCLCEQGLELGSGSHGICPRHAEVLLQHYRVRRACRLSA